MNNLAPLPVALPFLIAAVLVAAKSILPRPVVALVLRGTPFPPLPQLSHPVFKTSAALDGLASTLLASILALLALYHDHVPLCPAESVRRLNKPPVDGLPQPAQWQRLRLYHLARSGSSDDYGDCRLAAAMR